MGKRADPFDTQVLVLKAQQGDDAAFGVLVQRYEPAIKRLIMRYVSDLGEVSDLSQEIFLKMFKSLHHFRGDSQFYTWLYRVAVNTVKNYLVYKGHHIPTSDLSMDDEEANTWLKQLPFEASTPENLLISKEVEQLLIDTLKALPKELRLSLLMRELEGHSYEEIAEVMHCPVGTVRSRIFRARAAVMHALEDKTIARHH